MSDRDPTSTALTAARWDGLPLNPEVEGWHWLREKRGGLAPWLWTDDGCGPGEFYWGTDDNYDPDKMARYFDYVAPCVPPEPLT